MHVRQTYGYDEKEVSDQTSLECLDPSLTIQSQTQETDINYIVAQYGMTGTLPSVRVPQFGDFTDVHDFASAQLAIRTATEAFASLPPRIRAIYGNDPQLLLEASARPGFDQAFRALFGEDPPEIVSQTPADSPAGS